MGQYHQAIEIARPALEANDEVVVNALATGIYSVMPYYLLHSQAETGLFADALSSGQIMMRRAEAAGHPFAIEIVCVGLGYAHVRRGVASQAVPLLERGIKFARPMASTSKCRGLPRR